MGRLYKPRRCEGCDKEFIPKQAATLYCSEECKRNSRPKLQYCGDVDWVNAKYEELLAAYTKLQESKARGIDELLEDNKRLRQELKALENSQEFQRKTEKLENEQVDTQKLQRRVEELEGELADAQKLTKSYEKSYEEVVVNSGGGVSTPKSRKCHDCSKPTNDYRCSQCLARWRKKNNVPLNVDCSEEVYL